MTQVCPAGLFCIERGMLLFVAVVVGAIIWYHYWIRGQASIENLTGPYTNWTPDKMTYKSDRLPSPSRNGLVFSQPPLIDLPSPYPISFSERAYQRLINPLIAPARESPYFNMPSNGGIARDGMEINFPTRGPEADYQQVGILTDRHKRKILSLFGRPTYPGSNKWNYFTSTDKYNQIKIPVTKKGKTSTQEHGIDELYDKDKVDVPAYGNRFKVTLYDTATPRYIPYYR